LCLLQNNGKAGKKTNGDADRGAARPKKLDDGRKAAGKGRTVTFMFPHTVLDYHVTYRMLCILYM
jgi:hypothetical protein